MGCSSRSGLAAILEYCKRLRQRNAPTHAALALRGVRCPGGTPQRQAVARPPSLRVTTQTRVCCVARLAHRMGRGCAALLAPSRLDRNALHVGLVQRFLNYSRTRAGFACAVIIHRRSAATCRFVPMLRAPNIMNTCALPPERLIPRRVAQLISGISASRPTKVAAAHLANSAAIRRAGTTFRPVLRRAPR